MEKAGTDLLQKVRTCNLYNKILYTYLYNYKYVIIFLLINFICYFSIPPRPHHSLLLRILIPVFGGAFFIIAQVVETVYSYVKCEGKYVLFLYFFRVERQFFLRFIILRNKRFYNFFNIKVGMMQFSLLKLLQNYLTFIRKRMLIFALVFFLQYEGLCFYC